MIPIWVNATHKVNVYIQTFWLKMQNDFSKKENQCSTSKMLFQTHIKTMQREICATNIWNNYGNERSPF